MEVHVLPNFLSFIQFLSSTVEQLYFLNVSTDFVFPTVLENLTHLVFKMRPRRSSSVCSALPFDVVLCKLCRIQIIKTIHTSNQFRW